MTSLNSHLYLREAHKKTKKREDLNIQTFFMVQCILKRPQTACTKLETLVLTDPRRLISLTSPQNKCHIGQMCTAFTFHQEQTRDVGRKRERGGVRRREREEEIKKRACIIQPLKCQGSVGGRVCPSLTRFIATIGG